jgi:hypothetical protein
VHARERGRRSAAASRKHSTGARARKARLQGAGEGRARQWRGGAWDLGENNEYDNDERKEIEIQPYG